MDDATLAGRLRQFGFSEKEVDTYLSILAHGEATASTIADDTGVSKRYVYSIAETLEDRGFVEVLDHVVPRRIRANPPAEVIGTLSADLTEMEPALESRYTRVQSPEEEFEVIKSRATVIKRVREFVDGANAEVTLSLPLSELAEIADALASAVDRGVLVLLLVTDAADADAGALAGRASVARTWGQSMPIMMTADAQYGLVSPPEMITRTTSDARAISLVQEQLVPVLVGSFLGNYWPMATESFVADPLALPHAFENFRHAVFQATLHLRADDPVGARAVAAPVGGDGEERVVQGPVVDTKQGLVDPATNAFPVEHSLVVETGEGSTSIGGPGSFLEDFEAREVTLEPVESE